MTVALFDDLGVKVDTLKYSLPSLRYWQLIAEVYPRKGSDILSLVCPLPKVK
jgi:hypothetical protein